MDLSTLPSGTIAEGNCAPCGFVLPIDTAGAIRSTTCRIPQLLNRLANAGIRDRGEDVVGHGVPDARWACTADAADRPKVVLGRIVKAIPRGRSF